ncbi:hypothetical protein BJP36_41070 [Moorena producens JHB]|uniref:Uncharacterized protein n=1 Tax=Moorena producens (strain JHB) TaxID=1454205 RepID=A0A9Q9SSB4_MOOP1|nr:hypothetical protein [Moorena producens]WAN68759.1 hypothetical protein BJP36_41070 [Moorena producens JHB]
MYLITITTARSRSDRKAVLLEHRIIKSAIAKRFFWNIAKRCVSLGMNRSRVGILPARKYIETGKMPVLPRCQFWQDASSTKMPVLARCQFYQDAHSTGATRFPIPDSRFPFPSWEGLGVGSDSRFPTPVPLLGGVRGGFRLPTPDSQIRCSLFPIPYLDR